MNIYLVITRGSNYGYAYVVYAGHGNRARGLVQEQLGTTEHIVEITKIVDGVGEVDEGVAWTIDTHVHLKV